MAKMNKEELMQYRNMAEAGSIHASDQLNADHKKAYDYYSGHPLGNEVEDESKVISTDVFDVVEADMPSLVRVFLGANEILKFTPINDSLEERRIAEEKTKYINQLVRNQPDSYKTIFDWLKGAEIYKYSAVNFGFEEEDTVKVVEFEGLSEEEFEEVKIELQIQQQEGAMVNFEEVDRDKKDDLKDLKATIKKTVGRYFNRYINPEDFIISKGATSVDEAQTVGHDQYVTKSDLVAMGYSKEVVKDLPSTGSTDSTNAQNRMRNQGGTADGNASHWTGELVKLETRYIKIDKDGDGIAERLKMVTVGEELLEDLPYEIAPYAVLVSVMMPGQLIGKSRAEITMETQDIKTALLRQTMMNMYQVGAARMAINEQVNKDDAANQRVGGLIRTKGKDNPLNHIAAYPTPFIGDKALMVLQYADTARAQRTGSLMANQALDSDKMGKETAARFNGVQDAGQAKIELVARGHAETGFRSLYMGMLWTVAHFQKDKTEIMVLGKPLTVDPRRWLTDQPMVCNVGLGAGDDDTILQNMGSLLSVSQQLASSGSPLTDMSKQYNILSRITKAMNQSDVDEFFNNPEQPEELLQAQVEQLQRKNQQLEQQVQTNPLAEAEMVKREGEIAIAQGKLALEGAKLTEDQRQFDVNALQSQEQFNEEMKAKYDKLILEGEAKYTELELKYNEDVPGSRV